MGRRYVSMAGGPEGMNYWSPRHYLGATMSAILDRFASRNRGPATDIVDGVYVDFKRGIRCGTAGASEHVLAYEAAATAWERRDFFREGYALGLAAVHALTLARGNPEQSN